MENQISVYSTNTIRSNGGSVQNVAKDGTMVAHVGGQKVTVLNDAPITSERQHVQYTTASEPLFGNNIREAVRILRDWVKNG